MKLAWANIAIFISVLNVFQSCDAFTPPVSSLALDVRHTKEHTLSNMISSGFSFSDGEQILVSLQKPLGIVLEQDAQGPIIVTEVNQGELGVNITSMW